MLGSKERRIKRSLPRKQMASVSLTVQKMVTTRRTFLILELGDTWRQVNVVGLMVRQSPHARLLSSTYWPSADSICPRDPKEQRGKGRMEPGGQVEMVRNNWWPQMVQGQAHELHSRVQDDLQGTSLSYTLETTGRILEKSLSGAKSLLRASVSLIFQEQRTMNMGNMV